MVTILEQRCKLAPPFCRAMVNVMSELQRRRQGSQVFAGKHGFVTARDLLRWANRKPATYQALADDGFMLLGERLRRDDERAIVREVVERNCKAKVDTSYAWDSNMRKRDKPEADEGATKGGAGRGSKRAQKSQRSSQTLHNIDELCWTYTSTYP